MSQGYTNMMDPIREDRTGTTLADIIARVGWLMIRKISRERFHDQCQRFDLEVLKRGDRIVQHREELRDLVWAESSAPGAAPLGLTWHREGCAKWLLRPVVFAMPIPHPLDWLWLPNIRPAGWLVDQLYGNDSLPRLSESDALCADYVLLAIVYAAAMLENPRVSPPVFYDIWGDDVDWIRASYQRLVDGEGNGTLECWLRSALTHIEADPLLSKKGKRCYRDIRAAKPR